MRDCVQLVSNKQCSPRKIHRNLECRTSSSQRTPKVCRRDRKDSTRALFQYIVLRVVQEDATMDHQTPSGGLCHTRCRSDEIDRKSKRASWEM